MSPKTADAIEQRLRGAEKQIHGAEAQIREIRYLLSLGRNPEFNRMMEQSDDPDAGIDAETLREKLGF